MPKVRNHNEYFEPVALKRRSCRQCKMKFAGDEHQWRWFEYSRLQQYTVTWFCHSCFREEVVNRLVDHTRSCHCTVELIVKGTDKPEWLTL